MHPTAPYSLARRIIPATPGAASFAASTGYWEDYKERAAEREIYSTELVRAAHADELVFSLRGCSFLRRMVRKMVGALLDVGRATPAAADIERLFELRD